MNIKFISVVGLLFVGMMQVAGAGEYNANLSQTIPLAPSGVYRLSPSSVYVDAIIVHGDNTLEANIVIEDRWEWAGTTAHALDRKTTQIRLKEGGSVTFKVSYYTGYSSWSGEVSGYVEKFMEVKLIKVASKIQVVVGLYKLE